MANQEVLSLIDQLEKDLPPELVAQLKLPVQQEQFEITADAEVESYFDADAPTGVDAQQAAEEISAQSQFNIETTAQRQRRLDARASAARSSAESQFKASPWRPSIPRRYGGGR